MSEKTSFSTSTSPSLLRRLIAKKSFVWTRDVLVIAILFVAVTSWQARNMLSTDGSVQIQQQNLVSLEGEVLPLLATDKPNLIYFFAPWCQICALSIGNLDYLNPDKVNIVVIALDFGMKEEVQSFVDEHQVNSRVLLGHDTLKQEFQVQGYPSYYLLDENNTVASSSFGYSTAVGLKLREVFGP